MSPGLWLAVLALAQLLLPGFANRILEDTTQSWFIDQAKARGNDGLGIATFFTGSDDDVGRRADALLHMAKLVATTRSVLTASGVSVVGLIVTGALVLVSDPQVEFRNVRLAGLVIALALALGSMWILFGRVSDRTLREHSFGESIYRAPQRKVVKRLWHRLKLLWYRLKQPELITRYYAVVIVANAVSIVAAVNL